MKKVSFEEIGAVVATFLAGDNAKKGQMVNLSAADTVDGCSADGKAWPWTSPETAWPVSRCPASPRYPAATLASPPAGWPWPPMAPAV